jgi:hypothetical protein
MKKGRGVQNGVADIVEWREGEGSGGGSATLLSHVSRGLPGMMVRRGEALARMRAEALRTGRASERGLAGKAVRGVRKRSLT